MNQTVDVAICGTGIADVAHFLSQIGAKKSFYLTNNLLYLLRVSFY
jgi:hypothetical protein